MKGDTVSEPINAEWLHSVGIYQSDEGKLKDGDPPVEFGCRIVGGTDDGWKEDSDQDEPGDEIANLVVVPAEDGSAAVYVETYKLPGLETVSIVELGVRKSRVEILDLCRALKAWAITYSEDHPISAAPDLMAACEELLEICSNISGSDAAQARQMARVAIAKARGN